MTERVPTFREEIARFEHELQHEIIRAMVGRDIEHALYPQCFERRHTDDPDQ